MMTRLCWLPNPAAHIGGIHFQPARHTSDTSAAPHLQPLASLKPNRHGLDPNSDGLQPSSKLTSAASLPGLASLQLAKVFARIGNCRCCQSLEKATSKKGKRRLCGCHVLWLEAIAHGLEAIAKGSK